MHYLNPDHKKAYLVIFYCDFRQVGPHCHIGLGVNGLHTVKVLRKHGIHVDIFGVKNAGAIQHKMRELRDTPTHVVIEAPWIPIADLHQMLFDFPSSQWIVRTHSQIAFLQADRMAITLLRQMIALEESTPNFNVCVNSLKLQFYLETVYAARCLYLPNLYDYQRSHMKRRDIDHHRTLRIGSFGALRPLKNHTTAGAVALLVAEQRRCDLEFWFSVNRDDNSSMSKESLRNMFAGLKWAKLVENPWEDWTHFRRTVSHMDLCIQLSFTESFNITTADACAEGVPSVVSDAIDWAPPHWIAPSDDAAAAARVGLNLLSDHNAAADGFASLKRFVDAGTRTWIEYLDSNPT